jgi:hypothetical protein
MTYWLVYMLILVGGGGGLLALLLHLHRRRPGRENIPLAGLTLFLTLMALEFYFKVFFVQSDALKTLADRAWHDRYYAGGINSWGYRDAEWTPKMVAGKTKVMVVGDSFVEGAGIEYPQDRFPDQLAQQLGEPYVVLNLGKRGANTPQEIEAILTYPYPPDILILSYFINDIDNLRWWYNVDRGPGPGAPPPLLQPLERNSYAFNFFYWRAYRLLPAGQVDSEWAHLLKLYNDPNAWWLHQQDLLSIEAGARAEGVPLVVVVFPSMNRPAESQPITERVIALFAEREVPVLDVAPLIADIPMRDRLASPVDPHPSEQVHARVAEALYGLLTEEGLVAGEGN